MPTCNRDSGSRTLTGEVNPVRKSAKLTLCACMCASGRFTSNETGVLVASDVAARGLDLPQVQHVIHYQVPRNTEVCTMYVCIHVCTLEKASSLLHIPTHVHISSSIMHNVGVLLTKLVFVFTKIQQ